MGSVVLLFIDANVLVAGGRLILGILTSCRLGHKMGSRRGE